MLDLLEVARFAKKAHEGQMRKHGNEPYITHPMRIAARVMLRDDATREMVAAAMLHDVVEDCNIDVHTIDCLFGDNVGTLVSELTNPSKGSKASRAERKQMDRDHLKGVSKEAKIIKLLDRIDNLKGFIEAINMAHNLYELTIAHPTFYTDGEVHDIRYDLNKQLEFLTLYRKESKLLLDECLTGVDKELEEEFRKLI
jgi:hypothetical protein